MTKSAQERSPVQEVRGASVQQQSHPATDGDGTGLSPAREGTDEEGHCGSHKPETLSKPEPWLPTVTSPYDRKGAPVKYEALGNAQRQHTAEEHFLVWREERKDETEKRISVYSCCLHVVAQS